MPKEHFFGKINLSDTDPLRTDLLEIYSLDGKSYILAVFGNYPPTLPTPAVYQRCLATTSRLYRHPPSIAQSILAVIVMFRPTYTIQAKTAYCLIGLILV